MLLDAATGEPLHLVTDHYWVADAAALERALAAQADITGRAGEGWQRVSELADGSTRILLSINPGSRADRVEVSARTHAAADAGRVWFEGLAGSAVAHLTRKLADPRNMAADDDDGSSSGVSDGSPEQTTRLFEQVMRCPYANWVDEPIPILGDLTPRQAMKTPAGLERVKGLIREYEDNETRKAQADGRGEVSCHFLWISFGITR